MIKPQDLIAKFRQALDEKWGYIYGKKHEMWSAAKQAAYAKAYADDPDRANSATYGGKWAGHWVTDCSGLFAWSFEQLGYYIAHGSNSIWDGYLSDKGTLKAGKRTDGKELKPGTAVLTSKGEKHNHIGLYIGNGTVIEAMGAKNGVTTTKITNSKWTHWGELKKVDYAASGGSEEDVTAMAMAKVVLPSGKSGTNVNLRSGASTSAAVRAKVPIGAEIDILKDLGEWCFIRYQGTQGYMMSNYIEYAGSDNETGDGDGISDADREKIDTALKQIENAAEVIGSIIGRG